MLNHIHILSSDTKGGETQPEQEGQSHTSYSSEGHEDESLILSPDWAEHPSASRPSLSSPTWQMAAGSSFQVWFTKTLGLLWPVRTPPPAFEVTDSHAAETGYKSPRLPQPRVPTPRDAISREALVCLTATIKYLLWSWMCEFNIRATVTTEVFLSLCGISVFAQEHRGTGSQPRTERTFPFYVPLRHCLPGTTAL